MNSNTNFNLYKSFIAVFETKNLHRAADDLGISHVAVFQNIKTLEGQLGSTLFNASRKGLEPNSTANELYPQIKSAVETILGAEKTFKNFDEKSTGVIKMACQSATVEFYLKDFLRVFCEKYPHVKFEFFKREGMDLLKQNKIDFVIDLEYLFKDLPVKTIPILKVGGVFAASRDFLKSRGLNAKMSKPEFLKLPIISRAESWQEFYRSIDTKANIELTKTASNDLTFSMTKSGIGVGCFARELLDKVYVDPTIVRLEIDGVCPPTTKIVCAFNGTMSKPARAFIDGLVKYIC
jgi:DNA-binding transcriptional LysR family regulator